MRYVLVLGLTEKIVERRIDQLAELWGEGWRRRLEIRCGDWHVRGISVGFSGWQDKLMGLRPTDVVVLPGAYEVKDIWYAFDYFQPRGAIFRPWGQLLTEVEKVNFDDFVKAASSELLRATEAPGVQYFDFDGSEMGEDYVETLFGVQEIHVPDVDPPVYRLATMQRFRDEHRVLTVRVIDEDGNPMQGVTIGIAPVGISAETRKGPTGPGGLVQFSMDDSAVYSVPSESPHYVVGIDDGHSWIVPVGIVRGRRTRSDWLNPTFQFIDAPPEPEPEPEPDNWQRLFDKLDRIINWLESS